MTPFSNPFCRSAAAVGGFLASDYCGTTTAATYRKKALPQLRRLQPFLAFGCFAAVLPQCCRSAAVEGEPDGEELTNRKRARAARPHFTGRNLARSTGCNPVALSPNAAASRTCSLQPNITIRYGAGRRPASPRNTAGLKPLSLNKNPPRRGVATPIPRVFGGKLLRIYSLPARKFTREPGN